MTDQLTKDAAARLDALRERAELQMYGPRLLLADIRLVCAELARLHSDLAIAGAAIGTQTEALAAEHARCRTVERVVRAWVATHGPVLDCAECAALIAVADGREG